MKIAVALTGFLLTLTVSAACTSRSEPDRPSATAIVAQQPTETPTVLPTVSPTAAPTTAPSATPTPSGQNVALLGTGRASAGEDSVHRAIDDDLDTAWSSAIHPAQWIVISLDTLHLVDRIELVTAQAPPGPTTHVLWLDNGSGVRTQYKHLTDIHTEDWQTLTVEIDPPRPIKEILVQTLSSPSWVAWREIRLVRSPLSDQVETETPPQLRLEKVLDQLVQPVQAAHAGDGSGRLFILEQQGRIRIARDGVANEALFLDISKRVGCCEERGLLNIAFPPDYSESQQFYLSYSNLDDDTVISRFNVSADPDMADPNSEEILLIINQPHEAHNGGRLLFGPHDGYLYIGVGDGGSDGYPMHTGQDPGLLLGKILRIDVDSTVSPYGIPPSNPFIEADGYRPEIWAMGLRNPWGFAFDPLTAELFIPDVGHNKREELNYVPASSPGGENFGWPTIEGTRCMEFPDLPVPCRQAGIFQLPVAEYDHTGGCSIIGGAVYRGASIPHLQGQFIFADFCRGAVWSIRKTGESEAAARSRENLQDWYSEFVLSAGVPVSSIGEDEDGNLYVTGYADGVLYKIVQQQAAD